MYICIRSFFAKCEHSLLLGPETLAAQHLGPKSVPSGNTTLHLGFCGAKEGPSRFPTTGDTT